MFEDTDKEIAKLKDYVDLKDLGDKCEIALVGKPKVTRSYWDGQKSVEVPPGTNAPEGTNTSIRLLCRVYDASTETLKNLRLSEKSFQSMKSVLNVAGEDAILHVEVVKGTGKGTALQFIPTGKKLDKKKLAGLGIN